MKLVSFSESDGRIRPGVLLDKIDIVLDLAPEGHADVLSAISAGVAEEILICAQPPGGTVSLDT